MTTSASGATLVFNVGTVDTWAAKVFPDSAGQRLDVEILSGITTDVNLAHSDWIFVSSEHFTAET
jgi:hypothetical protein